MRQLLVELRRLMKRRAVAVGLLVGFAFPMFLLVTNIIETSPPSAAKVAEAEQLLEEALADPGTQASYEQCLAAPEDWGLSSADQCEETLPQLEWFLGHPTLDLSGVLEGTFLAMFAFLAMIAALLGTTFVGADWASGSMSNQLLFNSRRLQVWGAKAAAVALVTALLATVTFTITWLAYFQTMSSRDLEVSASVRSEITNQSLIAIALVALSAVCAYSLTMFFRSTVASLGLIFGYVTLGSLILLILPIENQGRWLFTNNVMAILKGKQSYFDMNSCMDSFESECVDAVLTRGDGAAFLGTGLVIIMGVSLWSFLRHDVP